MANDCPRAAAALPVSLDPPTASLVARFLGCLVEDTIAVPLPGDDDVFFDSWDLYQRFEAFCGETGDECLSPEEFDRILSEA
jgi:hypothetical protein